MATSCLYTHVVTAVARNDVVAQLVTSDYYQSYVKPPMQTQNTHSMSSHAK
jgi:hypothetical protein